MDISLIICTKDRPGDLATCLDSIERQARRPEEIIVVDASGDADTQRICLSRDCSDVKIRYIKTKPGITAQRNAGVKQASCSVMGFIDDDSIMERHCLEEIEKTFLERSDIGAATGIIETPPLSLFQNIFRRLFLLIRLDGNGRLQPSGYPAFCYSPKTDIEVNCARGGFAFYKKEVFSAFSFDENISNTGCLEDVDFSFRVSKAFKLLQTSRAKIFHGTSNISRKLPEEISYAAVFYHHYFFDKNMEKTALNLLAFSWSSMGDILRCLYWILKARSIGPAIGVIKAYRDIIRYG